MSKTLRVAVIGAGFAAREHVPAWQAQPKARVDWVVDVDLERARRLAGDFGVSQWATDYRPLIGRADIDVADICLPPRLHAAATVGFLDAGKHVLLEKPLVTSLDEAARVIDAEQRSTGTLMVAENWPFSSTARRVRQLIDDGLLGDVFMLRAHHESAFYLADDNALPPELQASTAVGGYTMTLGIHSINLAAQLMDGFESVFAYAADRSPSPLPFIERDVVLSAKFGNGGIGCMNFTGRSRHLGERRLAFGLFGTRGVAEFDILHGDLVYTVDGVRTQVHEQAPSMGYVEEIAHFCACIADGTVPLTSARQQLEALATVLAAYRSMHTRQEVQPAELLAEAGLRRSGPSQAMQSGSPTDDAQALQ